MPSDREFSPASDDADALVADLLQQFSSADSGGIGPLTADTLPPAHGLTVSRPAVTNPPLPPVAATSSAPELKAFAVEVSPPPSSDSEYGFLPGHSTVRQILSRKHTSSGLLYMVDLESSDKEWVSLSWSNYPNLFHFFIPLSLLRFR
jgi:chromodomain-helicase-DNA-binding protein 4